MSGGPYTSAILAPLFWIRMPKIDHLECSRCHHRESAETPKTVCPVCAGTFYVRYDLSAAKGIAVRDSLPNIDSMWRYAPFLPDVTRVTLAEGWTPILPSRRNANVLLKEEGANPTGTFKARGMSICMTMVKHYGIQKVAVPSAGNAGGACAAYAAAAGIEAH